MSPSSVCNLKVLGPSFSVIINGPSHRHWNFVCFPLSSCSLSHFKTKSPTSKYRLTDFLRSNQRLTVCWCFSNFFLANSLSSSSFCKVLIQCSMEEQGISCTDRASCKEGKNKLGGKMASLPYTRKKGEFPIAALGVTLSAHKAFNGAVCRFL